MRAAGADLVVMTAYVNDSIVLFRTMASQNFKPLVIGYGQGHVQPALLQAGKIVEGSFGVVEWMPDINKESVKKFVAAFEAKYKAMPPPTSAQAYVSTWAIFATLNGLRARGIAILLVEQNVGLSLEVASFAYVLARGKVVLEGAASELVNNAAVRSAYLGAENFAGSSAL